MRQRYRVQRLAPAPLETRGIVADYQPQDDMLTVWDSTQHPHAIRDHLAQVLHRPESRVRVVAPDVGGGFGEKGGLYPEEIAVPYLAIRLGRPVKWVEERWANLLAFHGRGHTVDVEAAAQRDGTLLGLRVQIVADLGAYFLMSTPTVPLLTSHRLAGPYKTPAMHVEVRGVITNKPPTGAYRGAGGPSGHRQCSDGRAIAPRRPPYRHAPDAGKDMAGLARAGNIARVLTHASKNSLSAFPPA